MEACKTAAHILNWVPSKSVPNTPFELWRKSGGWGVRRPPAARHSDPGEGARGGPPQLAGRRGRLSHRPARGSAPWEATVSGRD
jgi:hypothetical protein